MGFRKEACYAKLSLNLLPEPPASPVAETMAAWPAARLAVARSPTVKMALSEGMVLLPNS